MWVHRHKQTKKVPVTVLLRRSAIDPLRNIQNQQWLNILKTGQHVGRPFGYPILHSAPEAVTLFLRAALHLFRIPKLTTTVPTTAKRKRAKMRPPEANSKPPLSAIKVVGSTTGALERSGVTIIVGLDDLRAACGWENCTSGDGRA